jgi:acetyl esterase/lipase
MAANPSMELDEMRRMFEHWGDVTAEPGGVDYVEVTAGGQPALWATPKGSAQDRVLLCTHGGGYVTGSMYTHRKVYGHLAKAIDCRALIVHYRRAPENMHPGPVDDVVTAYRWLLNQGVKPQHIALTGDSAGGALAVTTLLRAHEHGLPMPAATTWRRPARASPETAKRTCWYRVTSSRSWRAHFWAKVAIRRIRWPTRSTPT